MLDKVLYSYAVNASTPGVTVDGKYYVVPLQPIKDWLAANAPEYRLAGAIAGNSSVRVYASKNGKAIYEVEKDPNYKPVDPKPAHTLIAKLGFRKADGTAVYSVDVYADDACVTRDGWGQACCEEEHPSPDGGQCRIHRGRDRHLRLAPRRLRRACTSSYGGVSVSL